MIPQHEALLDTLEEEQHSGRTYRINLEQNTISGFVDEQEAVRQAVYKILNTERFAYIIYSWNYGVELGSLFGQPLTYVLPELKRVITEALVQDDRIRDVAEFAFDCEQDKIRCTFLVESVYGAFSSEMEVNA